MGNCNFNCLKQTSSESYFKSDVQVEDIENNDKTNLYDINANIGKKNSPRGVCNPTQNNIKKQYKKDSSVNSQPDPTNETYDNKKKGESSTENEITYPNTHKKGNSKDVNFAKGELEANKFEPILTKLTNIVNSKKLRKIEKNKSTINIVLLGERCVGKTSIIFQYTSNKFDQYYITTIYKEDFTKTISLANKKYNLYFTVTSGDPQYQGDYTNIYKTCDFFVLVFDISMTQSFEKIKEILKNDIIQYVDLYKENYSNVIVVGNKCDLKSRKVSFEEASEYCKRYCIDYFEVSAKNNLNLGKVFNKITEVYDESITKL